MIAVSSLRQKRSVFVVSGCMHRYFLCIQICVCVCVYVCVSEGDQVRAAGYGSHSGLFVNVSVKSNRVLAAFSPPVKAQKHAEFIPMKHI